MLCFFLVALVFFLSQYSAATTVRFRAHTHLSRSCPSPSEAVRGGHIKVAQYLLSKGLDINFRTHNGTGGSPLWWAKHIHGKDHAMVKFLEGQRAEDIAPDKK